MTRAARRAASVARLRDARAARRPPVSVTIDELVIAGWPRGAAADIGDAIRHELTRLIGDRGAPPSMRQPAQLASADAGAVTVARPAQTMSIGQQIAAAIYGVVPR